MILLLWLEGPLQSWGVNSKFNRKTTLFFPTRSALCGMLCSSMGKKGEQEDFLTILRHTKLHIIGFRKDFRVKGNILKKEWLIEDYHTVGNGYNKRDPWENMCIPKKIDGSNPSNVPGSRITHRFYLVDCVFAVMWEMEDLLAKQCAESLSVPVYDLYLGRKSCIPSEFIFQGVFIKEENARERINELSQQKHLREVFEVKEVQEETEYELWDVPIKFGRFKRYDYRFVEVEWKGESY